MKPVWFGYPAPGSLEAAVALLQRYGGEAKALAGGQGLMPLLNSRLSRPAALVDLGRIPGLAYIEEGDGQVRLGAMTRQRTIEFSPVVARRLPLLGEATKWVGHLPIRTRGTIGGSIAHADPSAEYPAVLTALDGEVVARGPKGERVVKAKDFFVTYLTTSLEPDEILVEVRLPATAAGARSRSPMADTVTVRLTVNGVEREGRCEPRKLLVDFLREDLGLTGTHVGCEHGICGACTILLDGEAARSCIMLAVQADGAEILTIEGLAQNGKLHPLQEAFREHHGLQCGFCTPGMLMTALDLLRTNPSPTEAEIREGISAVLCRCTGYHGIIRAVEAAARAMR